MPKKSKSGGFGLQLPEGFTWLYLLGATIAVFALQFFAELAGFGEIVVRLFAFTPESALAQPWTLVTAMFLHADIVHIAFNMFALFMFGPLLEQKIGSGRFLALYFAAGIAGSLAFFAAAYLLPWVNPAIPAIGASGAIFGIMGALALLEPNLVIFMMFIPMPMWMAVIAWIIFETMSIPANTGIANEAHLGGLFAGLAFGYYLRENARKYIEEYEYIEP